MPMRTWLLILLMMSVRCEQSAERYHITYPSGAHHYRLLEDGDFCGELPVFSGPDPESYLGTVLDGASDYSDPETGQHFRAIRVMTLRNGERVDRWYRRDRLVGHAWILIADPRLRNCHYWYEETRTVSPAAREVPAD